MQAHHDVADVTEPPSRRDRRLVVAWCVIAVLVVPTPIWIGDLLQLGTAWRFGGAIMLGVVLGGLFPAKSAGRWLAQVKRDRGR